MKRTISKKKKRISKRKGISRRISRRPKRMRIKSKRMRIKSKRIRRKSKRIRKKSRRISIQKGGMLKRALKSITGRGDAAEGEEALLGSEDAAEEEEDLVGREEGGSENVDKSENPLASEGWGSLSYAMDPTRQSIEFTMEEVLILINKGEIGGNTQVYTPGMEKWERLKYCYKRFNWPSGGPTAQSLPNMEVRAIADSDAAPEDISIETRDKGIEPLVFRKGDEIEIIIRYVQGDAEDPDPLGFPELWEGRIYPKGGSPGTPGRFLPRRVSISNPAIKRIKPI